MTLCLMALYREMGRHLDAWDMASGMTRQIAWTPRWLAELQREGMLLERLFYPEKWIFIRHQLAGCEPREGGIGNMINCGAAMYIAPVGVVNAGDPRAAYDEAIAFASGHQASYGLEAAGVMAASVAAALIPGATVDNGRRSRARLSRRTAHAPRSRTSPRRRAACVPQASDHARVTAAFHAIIARLLEHGRRHRPPHPRRPGSLRTIMFHRAFAAIEELPLALGYALLNEGAFRKTVEDGVNSGRDTDSIGGMAGAILGALHGADSLRDDERALLHAANRVDLAAEADRFCDIALAIMDDDAARARAVAQSRAALGHYALTEPDAMPSMNLRCRRMNVHHDRQHDDHGSGHHLAPVRGILARQVVEFHDRGDVRVVLQERDGDDEFIPRVKTDDDGDRQQSRTHHRHDDAPERLPWPQHRRSAQLPLSRAGCAST